VGTLYSRQLHFMMQKNLLH